MALTSNITALESRSAARDERSAKVLRARFGCRFFGEGCYVADVGASLCGNGSRARHPGAFPTEAYLHGLVFEMNRVSQYAVCSMFLVSMPCLVCVIETGRRLMPSPVMSISYTIYFLHLWSKVGQ